MKLALVTFDQVMLFLAYLDQTQTLECALRVVTLVKKQLWLLSDDFVVFEMLLAIRTSNLDVMNPLLAVHPVVHALNLACSQRRMHLMLSLSK